MNPPRNVWKIQTNRNLINTNFLHDQNYSCTFSIIYCMKNQKVIFIICTLGISNFSKRNDECCIKKYSKKRCISNHKLGSVIFASRYPQLKNPVLDHIWWCQFLMKHVTLKKLVNFLWRTKVLTFIFWFEFILLITFTPFN